MCGLKIGNNFAPVERGEGETKTDRQTDRQRQRMGRVGGGGVMEEIGKKQKKGKKEGGGKYGSIRIKPQVKTLLDFSVTSTVLTGYPQNKGKKEKEEEK